MSKAAAQDGIHRAFSYLEDTQRLVQEAFTVHASTKMRISELTNHLGDSQTVRDAVTLSSVAQEDIVEAIHHLNVLKDKLVNLRNTIGKGI